VWHGAENTDESPRAFEWFEHVNKQQNTNTITMLSPETKQRIDACRVILAGRLPLPADQIDLITTALIYKFMDDADEDAARAGGRRRYFTGTLESFRWARLTSTKISAGERVNRFVSALEALADPRKAPQVAPLFRDIFRTAILKFRDERVFTLFLDAVNAFTRGEPQEHAAIFEYLLQCLGAPGEEERFRTPAHLVDFIVGCVNPKLGERVLDPACGTGGYLLSACEHILRAGGGTGPGGQLTQDELRMLGDDLRGYDVSDLMVKLCRINLYLRGFETPAARALNTLADGAHWDERADVILSTPPFVSPRGGVSPHSKFRLSAHKTEVLFTDYIAGHIGPNGRAAFIVPNGVVANVQKIYTRLRRLLVEDSLVAVVSLPAGVFKPYSGIKTSIVFLDRRIARRRDSVLLARVLHDGFDTGIKRVPPPRHNDLPEVGALLRAWLDPDAGDADLERLAGSDPTRWFTVKRSVLLKKQDVALAPERYAGGIPTGARFERFALGELCDIGSGGTPLRTTVEFWDNGTIPWISSKHITDAHTVEGGELITEAGLAKSSARIAPPGALLLVSRVTVGKWAIAKTAVAVNQDISVVTSKDPRLLPEFLECLAPSLAARIATGAVGTAILGVPREFVTSLVVSLPDLAGQRRFLGEIADYKKVLAGAHQIIGGYKTDLRPKPEWPLVPMSDLAEFEYGLPASPGPDGTTRYLRITDIDDYGLLLPSGGKFVPLDKEAARFLVKTGDVFIARVGGTAGKTLYIEGAPDAVFASYLIRARFNERMLPKFFWHYSKTPAYWAQRTQLLSGCEQEQFNASSMRQLLIPCPPLETQREVIRQLDADFDQIKCVREIIANYDAKTNAILDQLWTSGDGGDDSVGDAPTA